MKKFISILSILAFVFTTSLVFAGPNTDRVPATNNKSGRSILIPVHAVQVADNVFSLGTTVDKDSGKIVEGFAIVHRRDGYGHKPNHNPGGGGGNGGGGKDKGGASSCFGFLAKDAKWKVTPESWIVNPSNDDGLTDSFVLNTLSGGIDKWEDAADGVVDNTQGADILGNGSTTNSPLVADTVSTDGLNEVYFDSLDEGTIGVTIIWGIFGGRPSGRELLEWDQVYNTFYTWSDSGEANKMDFDNIATHELGHSVGMGDIYDGACSEETMYGFGSEGETSKRDLNSGDIAGISRLY